MRICIDSCVLINALQGSDPAAIRLLNLIGAGWVLLIPRLIAQEVTRNLRTPEQVRRFYRLFYEHGFAFIVDDPVPRTLVDKYVQQVRPLSTGVRRPPRPRVATAPLPARPAPCAGRAPAGRPRYA